MTSATTAQPPYERIGAGRHPAATHLGLRMIEAAVNLMIVLSTLTAAELAGPARDTLLEQRYQAQLIAIHTFAFSGAVW